MIKELTIAIILGALIGFGATSGIISLKNKNNPSLSTPTPTNTPTVNPDDSVSTPSLHTLSIQKPDNETVVNSDKLEIIGTTTADSQIVVHSQNDTFFITSDENGQFSQKVELDGGVNLIQISSISPDEQQVDTDLIVTYSTVEF